MATPPPVALTIAGSDNSAGAGAQADLKTMTALGVYGLTAITCVVAEVPGRVSSIQAVDPKIVTEQIRLSFEAFPVAAVKTGMLHARATIDEVCDFLSFVQRGRSRRLPLIVDPVMVASSGDPLLHADAVAVYRERLIPMATLVTPNLDEAAVLLGRRIRSLAELQAAGEELVRRFGTSFLLKGGHLIHESRATDLLFLIDGARHTFGAPFTPGVSTHGTGCTMSAAITSYVARGLPIAESVERAKLYVSKAIRKFHRWSAGRVVTDALNHGA
ncbi:MAG TPA: bifunctional hydroxymethylpyrimidine kinase/phosphomethylpyrimidine kinase [Chthoniobacteraceae bacterium]|jgi:hydroxymethylpyrimidine/phosphomethylpyrimidine kinase|nr:bifunctional hydroxymethylpyrimidine kinase/phosphomethylpyrimidine kinase [Chthoniobacteraceae bacterium]